MGIIGLIARFPFDIAANTWLLVLGMWLSGQAGIECQPEVLAGDGEIRVGPTQIHLAAIVELAILARRASEGIAQSRCASLACASGLV